MDIRAPKMAVRVKQSSQHLDQAASASQHSTCRMHSTSRASHEGLNSLYSLHPPCVYTRGYSPLLYIVSDCHALLALYLQDCVRTAYLDAVNYTIAWGPRANCRRWLFHLPRCKLASSHGISIVVVFLRLLALQHCISIAFMLPRALDAWDGAPRIVLVDMADCLLWVLLFLLCCELALHSCSLIGLHLRGN